MDNLPSLVLATYIDSLETKLTTAKAKVDELIEKYEMDKCRVCSTIYNEEIVCDKCYLDAKSKIKQLEEEFNTCEKLLDETREDLYKEQAENQRLTDALAIIAEDESLSFVVQQIARKAVKGK